LDGDGVRPLPRSLSRWAEELATLSLEARELFGAWLPVLERLRGAMSLPALQADGEPDGLSGLNRRGLYERLITTEWALLDVAPDEFVRRAGSGEQLFHELARAEATGAGRVVALFDAGPWQLGSPRLAHLAWLVVLAREARRRSVRFAWGVLQRPEEGLRESAQTGDLRALLAARSHATVEREMIAHWVDQLGPAERREERWLVTYARDERLATHLEAFTLAVAETDDEASSALLLDATSTSSLRERVTLVLPPARTCGRLLRDPLATEPAKRTQSALFPASIAAGEQVVFSTTSPHVLVRLSSGEVVALFAQSGQEAAIRPLARFTPPQGTSVVAAGWRKGKMYVVTSTGASLALHVSRGDRWLYEKRLELGPGLASPVTSPLVLGRMFVDPEGGLLWFCDEGWQLYMVDFRSLAVQGVGGPAFAWGSLLNGGEVGCVQRAPGGALQLRRVSSRGGVSVALIESAPRVSRGFVVASPQGHEPSLVALGAGDGQWQLCAPPWAAVTHLQLASEAAVFGAAMIEGHRCLLVRSATRERLDFIDGGPAVASLTFPDEVEHACIHPNGHWIAAQVAGGLCVVDRRGDEQLRWGGPWA
jgi:hypothetical protein